MNQEQLHINEHIQTFISKKSQQFDLIFDRIINPHKADFEQLLVYIDNLLNEMINDNTVDLRYLHVHFPYFGLDHNVILEFVCLKFFLLNSRTVEVNGNEVSYLQEHVERIEMELSRPIILSADANKKEIARKTEYRKEISKLKRTLLELKDLRMDGSRAEYRPKCLVNLLGKDKKGLLEAYQPTPYFMCVDDFNEKDISKPISYVLVNDKLDRDALDDLEIGEYKDILEDISSIIFFNSDGKSINRKFNYTALKKMNAEGLSIRNLLILSFDRKPLKLERLISYLGNMATRYLERTSEQDMRTYTIMPFEVDTLLGGNHRTENDITLLGKENMTWTFFQERINGYEDLQELISIKMRNVYSLSNSNLYRDIVLEDIFSTTAVSKLLSGETKARLMRLSEEDQRELKGLLSDVLDIVQDLQLVNKMYETISGRKCYIILPYMIYNCIELLNLIKARFSRYKNVHFVKWKDIDVQFDGSVIILDYRDPGRYPYQIQPNIFEFALPHAKKVSAIFLAMFFKYNYEYASFGYTRTLYQRVLDHPIRRANFKWNKLLEGIKERRPDNSIAYLWDLDNNYTSHTERDPIVITFGTGSKRSFYSSQLFVAKYQDDDTLLSIKAEEVIAEESDNKALFIQPLDELYEGLNLFETTLEEASEIQQLKKIFDLSDEDSEDSLWKVLLKKEAEKQGAQEVYGQLQAAVSKVGLSLVRESYFISHWVESQNDLLIPRSKKVFRVVCSYLKLPEVYFRVMLKRSASERLASRKSTAQMNQLIAALVNMGMFDLTPPSYKFDEAFMTKYDLEDIGFNIHTLTDEIYALAELCKSNIDLKEVITAELKQA